MKKRRDEVMSDSRRVTVWLPDELITRADRLADKADMERGRLLRNMIQSGVEMLESSEKVGVLQLSLLMRDIEDAVKEMWSHRSVNTTA